MIKFLNRFYKHTADKIYGNDKKCIYTHLYLPPLNTGVTKSIRIEILKKTNINFNSVFSKCPWFQSCWVHSYPSIGDQLKPGMSG